MRNVAWRRSRNLCPPSCVPLAAAGAGRGAGKGLLVRKNSLRILWRERDQREEQMIKWAKSLLSQRGLCVLCSPAPSSKAAGDPQLWGELWCQRCFCFRGGFGAAAPSPLSHVTPNIGFGAEEGSPHAQPSLALPLTLFFLRRVTVRDRGDSQDTQEDFPRMGLAAGAWAQQGQRWNTRPGRGSSLSSTPT